MSHKTVKGSLSNRHHSPVLAYFGDKNRDDNENACRVGEVWNLGHM